MINITVHCIFDIGGVSIGRDPSYLYRGEDLPHKESFKPSKISLDLKNESDSSWTGRPTG
jgi:hypothetical protein